MSKILEDINKNINSLNQNSQDNPTNSAEQEPNLMNMLVSSLTPLIPVALAKLTGQKLPVVNPVSNELGAIQQLTPFIQNLVNTQNILLQEIILLKKNDQVFANNFQSWRLTHEKKQIELNPNLENNG